MLPTRTTRLAPSPTGALHLGNARTFLVNWALARRQGWTILLRIEDLDTPRVKPGAVESTIDILAWLGMDWDRGPSIQSSDLAPYEHAMVTLAERGLAYPSALTRGEIEDLTAGAAASAPQEGVTESYFPASLRPPLEPRPFDTREVNWRFVTPPGPVVFDDGFAGPQHHVPSTTIGDFVVWTKRRQPSYQLAVVVDDARQGVTDVIRGDDLLDSAARQLLLYRALSLTPEPRYMHLPLVRGTDGKRLAKRHGDTKIETYRAAGVPSEALVGLLAAWSGVGDRRSPTPMTASEFADAFDPARMDRTSVTFTPEDNAWLLSQGR